MVPDFFVFSFPTTSILSLACGLSLIGIELDNSSDLIYDEERICQFPKVLFDCKVKDELVMKKIYHFYSDGTDNVSVKISFHLIFFF